jgi:hypothetical protein
MRCALPLLTFAAGFGLTAAEDAYTAAMTQSGDIVAKRGEPLTEGLKFKLTARADGIYGKK